MEDSEEWRPIAKWPEYEVSSHGRVRRIAPSIRFNPKAGRKMIMRKGGNIITGGTHLWSGYRRVALAARGMRRDENICVLVCQTFHGEKPSQIHQVAHWDGNKLNDRADNLRWATRSENSQDAIRHGHTQRGLKNVNGILGEKEVHQIRAALADGMTLKAIGTKFGVSVAAIFNIKAKRTWAWLE